MYTYINDNVDVRMCGMYIIFNNVRVAYSRIC